MKSRNHLTILNNLHTLGLNKDCIERIMTVVDNLPGKDHVKGVLRFLTEITHQNSRKEHYYQYSNWFAEYFCTISNLGLFAVAFYYHDFATLAAATFSALSHAIPLQRLHDLDFLGIFIIFGKVIANYKIIMDSPSVLLFGFGALTVNILDTVVTRDHLDKIGPTLHVIWHLAAAFALHKLNQAQNDFTESDVTLLNQIILNQDMPSFLKNAYDTIAEHIGNFSTTERCVIL